MKFKSDENIAYHAARILLLISYCGKPQGAKSLYLPAIEGRTLLAKLDLFLRYPIYLERAAEILNKRDVFLKITGNTPEYIQNSVESKMVRYRYGPWDHIYYSVLGYLLGKNLIGIESYGKVDTFRITALGQEVVKQLAESQDYEDIIKRAELTYKLFNRFNGNLLKDFIYTNFPEVVNRKIGEMIDVSNLSDELDPPKFNY